VVEDAFNYAHFGGLLHQIFRLCPLNFRASHLAIPKKKTPHNQALADEYEHNINIKSTFVFMFQDFGLNFIHIRIHVVMNLFE